jgi:hypothetical protein
MTSPLDRFTNRPARTESVTFPLDPTDADRVREAREAVRRAERDATAKPDDEAAVTALVEAEEAVAELLDSMITIRFDLVAIGPVRVEELMVAYPITKAQKAKALAEANGNPNQVQQFNVDTFPPALLAEAVTAVTASDDPDNPQTEVTEAQMIAMWRSGLSVADRTILFQTAMLINQAPSAVDDLGKG